MIILSDFFYIRLATECVEYLEPIVQFQFYDSVLGCKFDVIFETPKQKLTILLADRYISNDFSYQYLLKWIQQVL